MRSRRTCPPSGSASVCSCGARPAAAGLRPRRPWPSRATGPQPGVRAVPLPPAAAEDALFASLRHPAVGVHWNNDLVVELPPGATVLSTTAETVQALRLGPAAWGVQHHPEVEVPTLRLWADADVAGGRLDATTAGTRLAEVERCDAA